MQGLWGKVQLSELHEVGGCLFQPLLTEIIGCVNKPNLVMINSRSLLYIEVNWHSDLSNITYIGTHICHSKTYFINIDSCEIFLSCKYRKILVLKSEGEPNTIDKGTVY